MTSIRWIPVLMTITVFALGTRGAGAADFFVSTAGDDTWSGRFAAPNDSQTDGPFATVERAQFAVRGLKRLLERKGTERPMTVMVRGGTYYLDRPLEFGPRDSGSEQNPIVYMAHPGEQPVLSGGKPITSEWQTAGGKIYTTHIPEVADGQWYFRLLRVGDNWAIRARHPNYDPEKPYAGGWAFVGFGNDLSQRGAMNVGVEHTESIGARLTWRVAIPAAGRYHVWLRYGHNMKAYDVADMGGRTALRVDEGDWVPLENLPDTGGWGKFRWAHVCDVPLAAGEQLLTWINQQGGGINLDAFALCDDEAWDPNTAVGQPGRHGVYRVEQPSAGKHVVIIQCEACESAAGEGIVVPNPVPIGTRQHTWFGEGALPQWQDLSGAEMHFFPGSSWVSGIVPIASIDYDRRKIAPGSRGLHHHVANLLVLGNRFFIEGVREALDMPGEWHLDRATGTLSYWPAQDGFAQQGIVAPVLDRIVNIHGGTTPATRVSNICLVGLTFKDTRYTAEIRSYYSPPDAAVWVHNADDCVIESCRFTRLGGGALKLVGETRGTRFLGNTVEYVGQNGVSMVGDGATFPADNVVAGNHIHHIGLVYKHVAGVYMDYRDRSLARTPGNLVAHNLITDTPRYAISMKSHQGNNVIEYNELCRTNLETSDAGAIESYSINQQAAGNVIRFNLILDSIGLRTTPEGEILCPYYTWGIYLDDEASHNLVYGNICARNYRGGFCVHGGRENIIENNIFVDSTRQGGEFNATAQKQMVQNVFRRNIVYRLQEGGNVISSYGWTADVLAECDHNLYWHAGSEPAITFLGKSLAEWQQMGYDQHSVVADPLFVDLENDDYRLRPDSPALALGFQPIDVARIGLPGYDRDNY